MMEIDARASREVQAGKFPTLIFISLDLYTILVKDMYSGVKVATNFPGGGIVAMNTSDAGSLNLVPVHRLKNFLMIGRREEFNELEAAGFDRRFWSDQERVKLDQVFEEDVIESRDDET